MERVDCTLFHILIECGSMECSSMFNLTVFHFFISDVVVCTYLQNIKLQIQRFVINNFVFLQVLVSQA